MQFGKYELLHRVRIGGMAEVFRAREAGQPDRLLAIKRILPSFTDEADYVAMFIDEAQLGTRLRHRCIPAAIELGRVEDEYYLALEYVDGVDAGVLLRRARARGEPLPVPVACRIAREVCDALEYAHDLSDEQGDPLGIVHRDVSPQNVLISFDGEVKLIDFGIAKSTEQRMRTAAGLLKGKYGYLSPEQAQGHEVDRRSDLFSLGVCLYEMLSAQRLFFGATDFSTIARVRKAEIPDLHGFAPDVPDELVAIVERALAREPGERFQSAAELGAALDAFVERAASRFEPAELGAFARDAAADPQSGLASGDAGEQGDDGTGLLDAFDDVEPVSAVSTLAEPPQPPAPLSTTTFEGGALDPDEQDPDELYDTMPEERLAEPDPADEPSAPEEAHAAVPARGDATGEDLLEELSVDEPTHVVPYDAAQHGETATDPSDQAASPAAAEPSAEAAATEPAAPFAPPAPPPAAAGVAHTATLPGIGMEWDDEELSTQLYDPPEPGQSGPRPVLGSLAMPRSVPPTAAVPFAPAPSYPPGPSSAGDVLAHAGVAVPPVAGARTPSGRPGTGSLPPLSGQSTLPPRAPGPLLPRTGPAVWVVAGVLALAAVGVPLTLWLTRAPARGAMHLTTAPADAMVKIDGMPSGGRTSPFVLSNVTPDESHEIEVSKPGFRTWSARLTLSPGQIVQLPHVELAPEPGTAAATAPSAAAQRANVVVAPEPQPAAAPAEREQEQAAPRERPEPQREPPRATQPAARPRPRPAPAPAPVAAVERPTEPAPAPVTPETPREHAAPAAGPAGEGAPGILRINSRPWSRVYVDGRLIGTTPQMKITLGAGLHTVTLVNPDFGLQQVLSVQIAAGETVTKIVELSQ